MRLQFVSYKVVLACFAWWTTFFYDGCTSEGVVPIAYDLHIIAPLQDAQLIFQGRLSILIKCVNRTDVIRLNSKQLKLKTSAVSVTQENSPDVQLKIEKFFESLPDEEAIGMKLDRSCDPGNTYVLSFDDYSGRINGPLSYGLFFSDLSPSSSLYATQFQTNWARSVFPCFDGPSDKAVLRLSLEHPPDMKAMSNMKVKSEETTSSGWVKTTFNQTPRMSTYSMAFALLPRYLYLNVSDKSLNGINVTVHYNKVRITTEVAQKYLAFAKNALDYFEKSLLIPQPIEKLDLIVVPKLAIFGMENWGMITLNEEFLTSNEEQEVLSLITHEIAHQWFGNLVTNYDWRFLCIQEGLAEHYTRRVVKKFYDDLGREDVFDKYLVSRYIIAIQQETENRKLGTLVQVFKSLSDAGEFCFGKAPFVFDMLDTLVGRTIFDERISKFLSDFVFETFQLSDLVKYFDSNSTPTSLVLRYWTLNGGYPSVFISEKGLVSQKQLVKESSNTYRENDLVWPIPLTFFDKSSAAISNVTWLLSKANVTLPRFPRAIGQHYVINRGFDFFYRVNYDAYNWFLLSEKLGKNNADIRLITQLQVISDFCYFYSFGLLDRLESRITRINVLQAMKSIQTKTGLLLDMYYKDC